MITVVKNGRVIDPYNNIDSKLNIVIKDGKILEITPYEISGEKNIDATGLIVCPGFIDIHMHEDMYHNEEDYLDEWIAKSMLNMGVTTCTATFCNWRPIRIVDRNITTAPVILPYFLRAYPF